MLDNSLVHHYSSSRRKGGFILPIRFIADAGHESRKLTKLIKTEGYELRIVKRRKRAFAWIRRYRRTADFKSRIAVYS